MQCPHKDCCYREHPRGGFKNCGFAVLTGRLRNCPPDENCTRYMKGKRKPASNRYDFTYEKVLDDVYSAGISGYGEVRQGD